MENNNHTVEFLQRDFDQCFQQMRHYDCQIFEIIKFMSTAYVALIGAGIGLYQFGSTNGKDFTAALAAVFIVALLLGTFMYISIIRNRVYYVHVARYINEIRKIFLDKAPCGFANNSKMYINCKQPPFFNWRSSQAYIIYVTAFINACLLGSLLFVLFSESFYKWHCVIAATLLVTVIQIVWGIAYLLSREGKSASASVFGHE